MTRKILVTAALPYLNNVPHLGHMAGSHLPADIYARFQRSRGHDVVFVGGSDEHGTPNILSAKRCGLSPQEFCGKMHQYHAGIYKKFGISYNNYARTSSPTHHQTTQEFFLRLKDRGFITEKEAQQYFCPNQQNFLPDRYVEGACPKCGKSAHGDQCENCSADIDNNLISPHCTDCGSDAILEKTKHLFLNLPDLESLVRSWVEKQDSWRPHVKNEALKWLDNGLRARAITRDLEWGIKVPHPGYDKESDGKRFYVWFDAPIGYISATRELGREDEFWKDPSSEIVQFLGKDNIQFHTIFFPAMLLGHGSYNLPTNVFGLNFLQFKGEKFSKSKGKGVFCDSVLEAGTDINAIRAYLTTLIPETDDTNFRWEDFQTHVNGELTGKFGNAFNRVLSPLYKKHGGRLRANGSLGQTGLDTEMLAQIQSAPHEVAELLETGEIRAAYRKLMELAQATNKYLDDRKPWNQNSDDAAKTYLIAFNALKALAIIAEPFMPDAMNSVLSEQMGIHLPSGKWKHASEIVSHCEIGNPEPLFKKISDEELANMEETASQPPSLDKILGV
jgi:methionyl-tRNA synthetase